MMLDRGELKDWFGSSEIIIEAVLAGLGFYLFIVHMLTARHPFLNPVLFKDRNFVIGNIFIFVVGIILFATLALVPPLLQNLMNYPVVTTGLMTAPRGAGTMIGMVVVGRLVGRVDARIIMATGLALTALSLWQMTHLSLLMDAWPVVTSGILQGFGVGLVYVPLSTVTFATLGPQSRNEGTAFFNLLRNVGSSIGISVVQFLLTRNSQIVHADLAEHVTPFRLTSRSVAMLAALNGQISRQATMIAYLDDFQAMLWLTLAAIPLLLLFRRTKSVTAGHTVAME
jgi:DHA2 family multidrug resistance protein